MGAFTRYTRSDVTNTSGTLSIQWLPTDTTDLNLDLSYTSIARDDFLRNVAFVPFLAYESLPISSLGGEFRGTTVWEDAAAGFGVPGSLARTFISHQFESVDEDTSLLSAYGSTTKGKWTIDYKIGYSEGTQRSPNFANLSVNPVTALFGLSIVPQEFLLPEALENTVDGRMLSPFAPLGGRNSFPVPLLNEQGFDFFNDPTNYALSFMDVASSRAEDSRATAKIDLRYEPDNSYVKYVKVGLFREDSDSRNATFDARQITAPGASLAELGLSLSEDNLAAIGLTGGFRGIDENDFRNFVSRFQTNPLVSTLQIPLDERTLNTFLKEENTASYVESSIQLGNIEVIGGIRIDQTDVTSRNLTNPILIDAFGNRDVDFESRFTALVDQAASTTDVLPRILINYRPSRNLVVRAGYFLSVARPALSQLSSMQSVTLDLEPNGGPLGNQPTLQIIEGNPGLKPATTDNYDLSIEYYADNVGAVKLSLFWKTIENFLEYNATSGTDQLEGAVLPDDANFQNLPSNIYINRVRPFNNDAEAKIWGAELAFERQFSSFPGIWGGLGVYANYTYSDSEKKIFDQFTDPTTGEPISFTIDNVPFRDQPKHSGTFAVTYNYASVDASLAYTSQARRLRGFGDFGLHGFYEQDESLDLRVEYFVEPTRNENQVWRVYLEAVDLLKGTDDPDVERTLGGDAGVPKVFEAASYFGGRALRIGVSASFN